MFGNLHPVCLLCLSVCIWLFYVMYMQKIFVIRHELHERIVDVTVRQLKTIPAVLTLSSRSHSQRSPTLFKKMLTVTTPCFFVCLVGWLVWFGLFTPPYYAYVEMDILTGCVLLWVWTVTVCILLCMSPLNLLVLWRALSVQ